MPTPPGREKVYRRRSTPHCPRAVRQCIAGVALPTAHWQRGSVLQEVHGPLPQAVRQRNAGVTLPTAPRQWGSALQEFHCPLLPGVEAVDCRRCTAHVPKAVT